MKKILKILIYLLIIILGFVVSFLIVSGWFKEKISSLKPKSKDSVVTYKLSKPVLPLQNSKNISYVTTKEIKIEKDDKSYSYNLYVNDNNDLVIKNNLTGSEQVAKSISNVKYIIEDSYMIFVLTNGGDIYYIPDSVGQSMNYLDNLSIDKLDSFKKLELTFIDDSLSVEYMTEKIFFTNYIVGKCNGQIGCNFLESNDGNYYDYSITDIHPEPLSSLVIASPAIRGKYNSLDELAKKNKMNIYVRNVDFSIYDDGKVVYENGFSWDPNINGLTMDVFDESGKQLYAHAILAVSMYNIYFISLDNKLYNIEYNTINYETKFQAKLVKNSIIDSISYNKKKKLAILNFNDKTQLEIERISAGDLENIINKGVK